jgi:hypothetical protein
LPHVVLDHFGSSIHVEELGLKLRHKFSHELISCLTLRKLADCKQLLSNQVLTRAVVFLNTSDDLLVQFLEVGLFFFGTSLNDLFDVVDCLVSRLELWQGKELV